MAVGTVHPRTNHFPTRRSLELPSLASPAAHSHSHTNIRVSLDKNPLPSVSSEPIGRIDATLPSQSRWGLATRFKNVVFGLIAKHLDVKKRRRIGIPQFPVHLVHVNFNSSTGEYTGLPVDWQHVMTEITTPMSGVADNDGTISVIRERGDSLDDRERSRLRRGRTLQDPSSSSKQMVHQNMLSFLIAQVSRNEPSNDESLWEALRKHSDSMAALDIVYNLMQSQEYRQTLLQILADMGMSDDPRVGAVLRSDDEDIASLLEDVSKSDTSRKIILSLEKDKAQIFLDVVQDVLDRGFLMNRRGRNARRLLVTLSELRDILPSSLFIKGVTLCEHQATFGEDSDGAYRASYNGGLVALRRIRIFQTGTELHETQKKICREALPWQHLKHPYITPFLGIDSESSPSYLCMVSPWMRHGTVLEYLEIHGKVNVMQRLYEIAQGLAFLHSHNVVHGNLRGSNIFINDERRACLAEFGLTVFADVTEITRPSNQVGCLRWMAPELQHSQSIGLGRSRRTSASDVYAFACVCLELYTGRPPFLETPDDAAAGLRIIVGERPQRPSGEHLMSDDLWDLIKLCWSQHFADRPSIIQVFNIMAQVDESLMDPDHH